MIEKIRRESERERDRIFFTFLSLVFCFPILIGVLLYIEESNKLHRSSVPMEQRVEVNIQGVTPEVHHYKSSRQVGDGYLFSYTEKTYYRVEGEIYGGKHSVTSVLSMTDPSDHIGETVEFICTGNLCKLPFRK